MREIALHIADLVQNSLRAGAGEVEIAITEDTSSDRFVVRIADDGRGMEDDLLKKVVDPFTTTRTTRGVGMGVPLFKAACERCAGSFEIKSSPETGTVIRGVFRRSHIDRAPLGDIAGVISELIAFHPGVDFIYRHCFDERRFVLKSREIMDVLDGIPPDHPKVIRWIEEQIQEELARVRTDQ